MNPLQKARRCAGASWRKLAVCGLFAFAAASLIEPALAQTPVTITVNSGARQTFQGFGCSLVGPQPNGYSDLTTAQKQTLTGMVWGTAKFRILKTWLTPQDFEPEPGTEDPSEYVSDYITSGIIADAEAAGCTTIYLAPNNIPSYMGDGTYILDDQIPNYAQLIADFIATIQNDYGVTIAATGILNEPGDGTLTFTTAQWPTMVIDLRQALDADGLSDVKIVTPETANTDSGTDTILSSIQGNSTAWSDLDDISTHSYNMDANDDMVNYILGTSKGYWMTEAGGVSANGAESDGDAMEAAAAASRYLSDMNHMVDHWLWFLGYEVPNPDDDIQRMIRYTASPFDIDPLEKYYYLEQLSQTFDVGAQFRSSSSSLEGDMDWTYGHKPMITVAAAENPNGTWGVGISNFTSDYFTDPNTPTWDQTQLGQAAQTFDVTVDIPEMADSGNVTMQVYKSNSDYNIVNQGTITMTNGSFTLDNVGPLDLWTLRSVSGGGGGSASASFVTTDTTTQGSWEGAYGADGYNVIGDTSSYPSYATVSTSGTGEYTWNNPVTDPRGLQEPDSPPNRIAACWYTSSSETIDLNLTDGNTHQVALYLLDWDNQGRSETVQVTDAGSGSVLDTRSISSFSGGEYLVWNINGHVHITISLNGGPNAVVSGIFFGGGTSGSSASATFLDTDTSTQGSWEGVYGADGYNIIGDTYSYPSYATVTTTGTNLAVWNDPVSDTRALQMPDDSPNRIAACWYTATSETIDIDLTDSNTHQVALYLLDWDDQGRSETVQVKDANSGNVLDTRTASSFSGGEYLVWDMSGHVQLVLSLNSGPNAVESGLFFR